MEAHNCWCFEYHCRRYWCDLRPSACSRRRGIGGISRILFSCPGRSHSWCVCSPADTGSSGNRGRCLCFEETDLGTGARRIDMRALRRLVSGSSCNHIRYPRESRVRMSGGLTRGIAEHHPLSQTGWQDPLLPLQDSEHRDSVSLPASCPGRFA
jgi:hypothetical protein